MLSSQRWRGVAKNVGRYTGLRYRGRAVCMHGTGKQRTNRRVAQNTHHMMRANSKVAKANKMVKSVFVATKVTGCQVPTIRSAIICPLLLPFPPQVIPLLNQLSGLFCSSASPKIRMNDNVVDFVGLAVQWLLLPVLRVVLAKVHLGKQRMRTTC